MTLYKHELSPVFPEDDSNIFFLSLPFPFFTDAYEQGKLLSCEESADKLVIVLDRNDYKSGSHIDVYDV
ncbi:hypothetical protein DPMN_057866 [Dreissena polymorpha]|uniref:Uncharacterized protein n=1 Tax=Dreissena polymorpha TaxID=45954 RepID=A0A9D4HCP9_DREPO|nr:hypothetical protein DPMN_057866 [Dreissena polymorpha]